MPTYRHSLISPLKSVVNAFLYGQLVPFSTANAVFRDSNPATYNNKPPYKDGLLLVYPLGFEPRLDSVGGCYVIQLHYEYA